MDVRKIGFFLALTLVFGSMPWPLTIFHYFFILFYFNVTRLYLKCKLIWKEILFIDLRSRTYLYLSKIFEIIEFYINIDCCQALSISQSINLSLSLRDRADTIITFHPSTHHHHHRKLIKHLEVTYSQVWYIIGIVSSSPAHFHSEKLG